MGGSGGGGGATSRSPVAVSVLLSSSCVLCSCASRGDLSYVEGTLGSSWRDTRLPPIDAWGSVLEALAAAQVAAPSSTAVSSSDRRARKRRAA